ncbi:hypothetical protein D3C86_1167940 [compost metagenome]
MLKDLEPSASKSGLFIVHVPNVVILNCGNNLTCIRLLLVFRAKSCVTIEHNLLSRFVMHYNHGLLRPDGEQ